MTLILPLISLLAGCGPYIIPHPPPTVPLSSVQPLDEGDTRISAAHSWLVVDWASGPNYLSGANVLRLDRGMPWGDLGTSLGWVYPGIFSPIAGVQAGRTLASGERGSLGLTGSLGASMIDAGALYSSLSPGVGVRGVFRPTPWLGLAGSAGGSYSATWVFGDGLGPRSFWLQGSAGVLLGRPDGLQGGLAWQPIAYIPEPGELLHTLTLSVSHTW